MLGNVGTNNSQFIQVLRQPLKSVFGDEHGAVFEMVLTLPCVRIMCVGRSLSLFTQEGLYVLYVWIFLSI